MKTILVVDDSDLIRWVMKTALEGEGFKVEMAEDGVKAIELITGGLKPDLIITDLNMPNMDGLALIQNVRPMLRFTPILVVSTESQASKRDEAKKLGATGWLTKPVNPEDLLKVIRRVLPGA
ncbi:response regulator [Neorhizobium lilium]|uniref:Response regulator n=1 Tax=Neorhizobium lilium TaxID=2503024 RepID=A0A3S3T351_9HYPH|nr:response regulator [Neorhizobium lilium]RWX81003.1 response regulator [Neorhizobium lilium]